MNYKFEKVQHIFRWTNGEFKIEWSDSHIETHNDIVHLTDVSDIRYYYYTMEVFHKDDEENWQLLLSKDAYDFPALLEFQDMLNKCLMENENNQSSRCSLMDDMYELSFVENERYGTIYELIVGATIVGSVFQSITIPCLGEDDIEALKRCVDSFIKESMESYSRMAKERFLFAQTNKTIQDNKLYVKEKQPNGRVILEEIIVPGDKMDSIIYFEAKGDTFIEKDCSNVTVTSFDEAQELLRVSNGREFPLNRIALFMPEEPTDKLEYGIPEIICDFYGILSDDEKQEFKHSSVDELFEKYCWAIISRTWMCRGEHKFEEKYPSLLNIDDDGNHQRVFEVVKIVIQRIKCKLFDE